MAGQYYKGVSMSNVYAKINSKWYLFDYCDVATGQVYNVDYDGEFATLYFCELENLSFEAPATVVVSVRGY